MHQCFPINTPNKCFVHLCLYTLEMAVCWVQSGACIDA
jgi:hypothetical protein